MKTAYYYVIFHPECTSNAFTTDYLSFLNFMSYRKKLFELYFESVENLYIESASSEKKNPYGIGVCYVADDEFNTFCQYISERYGVFFNYDNFIVSTSTSNVSLFDQIYYVPGEISCEPFPRIQPPFSFRNGESEFVFCSFAELNDTLDFFRSIISFTWSQNEDQVKLMRRFISRFKNYYMAYVALEFDEFSQLSCFMILPEDLTNAQYTIIDERAYIREVLDEVANPLPFDNEEDYCSDLYFMEQISKYIHFIANGR